jgi:hypothetical protein
MPREQIDALDKGGVETIAASVAGGPTVVDVLPVERSLATVPRACRDPSEQAQAQAQASVPAERDTMEPFMGRATCNLCAASSTGTALTDSMNR